MQQEKWQQPKTKPCPFCGGNTLGIYSEILTEEETSHVECHNCGAKGPTIITKDKAPAHKLNEWAIDEWNDRKGKE